MSQMSRNVPKCLFCREVVSDNVLFPLPTRFEIVRVLTIVVVAKLWSHCLKIIYMNDFNHFYPNTELGIDLKLLTCRPGRIETGKVINGTITRDGEDHFTFVQNHQPTRHKADANPHLYRGSCVNIIGGNPDFRLSFNRPRIRDADKLAQFCRQAAKELRVIVRLVEKKSTQG